MSLRFRLLGRVATACLMLMVGLSSAIIAAAPAHATSGGPVILDGMDPGYHGYESGGAPEGAWLFIAKAYTSLMNASTLGTAGTVAVLGAPDSTAAGDDCGAGAHYAAASDSYTPTFYQQPADIDAFFTQLDAGTVTPRIIHIVDRSEERRV